MSETVTVALKHPAGIILRIFKQVDGIETGIGGNQKRVKVSQVVEKDGVPYQFVLNGNRIARGAETDEDRVAKTIVGGYALTPNVPKDLWEVWREQNKDHDLVRNHLIYATDGEARARDQAKDQRAVRSGLEPIDPNKPPVSGIATADEMKKTKAA
jgi:hypothetical protein